MGKILVQISKRIVDNKFYKETYRHKKTRRKTVRWRDIPTGRYIKKPIFRSIIVIEYSSKEKHIDIRVWVHTEQNNVTKGQLERKLKEFFEAVDIAEGVDKEGEMSTDLNRPIKEEEKIPEDADIGEWFGFADFGKRKWQYYARGKRLSQTFASFPAPSISEISKILET